MSSAEIVSTLYTTPYYTFGSPRYNAFRNFETILIPENYGAYDAINGTCDKYFPCYTLTENDPPKTELVDNTGGIVEQKGSFAFREHQRRFKTKIVGKKDKPASPHNSNLARHKIYSDKYLTTKINPGWCVLQTITIPPTQEGEKETYVPLFLIRALGNNSSIRQLFAIDLDDEQTTKTYTSNTLFLPGEIVKYKNILFKCITETRDYPPTKAMTNDFWQYMNHDKNVFNADVFAMGGNEAAYLTEVSDDTRRFNPLMDDNDSLVTWSLAYYHGI